jgi:hypothetical protein
MLDAHLRSRDFRALVQRALPDEPTKCVLCLHLLCLHLLCLHLLWLHLLWPHLLLYHSTTPPLYHSRYEAELRAFVETVAAELDALDGAAPPPKPSP